MKFSTEVVEDVRDLVHYHMMTIGDANKSKVKAVNKFRDVSIFKLWGLLRICDRLAKGERLKEEMLIEDISLIKSALTVKEKQPLKLDISGNDIMEMFDLKPGPEVGKYLTACKELVMEDPANNDREALVAFLNTLKA